jgi:hypothetical protein
MKFTISLKKGGGFQVNAENLIMHTCNNPIFYLPNVPIRLHAKGKAWCAAFRNLQQGRR